jgi:hypothetical protein
MNNSDEMLSVAGLVLATNIIITLMSEGKTEEWINDNWRRIYREKMKSIRESNE